MFLKLWLVFTLLVVYISCNVVKGNDQTFTCSTQVTTLQQISSVSGWFNAICEKMLQKQSNISYNNNLKNQK